MPRNSGEAHATPAASRINQWRKSPSAASQSVRTLFEGRVLRGATVPNCVPLPDPSPAVGLKVAARIQVGVAWGPFGTRLSESVLGASAACQPVLTTTRRPNDYMRLARRKLTKLLRHCLGIAVTSVLVLTAIAQEPARPQFRPRYRFTVRRTATIAVCRFTLPTSMATTFSSMRRARARRN
jgi:hypothetical protein